MEGDSSSASSSSSSEEDRSASNKDFSEPEDEFSDDELPGLSSPRASGGDSRPSALSASAAGERQLSASSATAESRQPSVSTLGAPVPAGSEILPETPRELAPSSASASQQESEEEEREEEADTILDVPSEAGAEFQEVEVEEAPGFEVEPEAEVHAEVSELGSPERAVAEEAEWRGEVRSSQPSSALDDDGNSGNASATGAIDMLATASSDGNVNAAAAGFADVSNLANATAECEDAGASQISGRGCSVISNEPQDFARALWLDPADFSFSSEQQIHVKQPVPENPGDAKHVVAEDTLYGHVWDMYCEHEELLTMAFEESILGLLQRRSELHSWRRRVRRLRRPFQEAVASASVPAQSSTFTKAAGTAESYAKELANRKESLLSLASEFRSLCTELRQLEEKVVMGSESNLRVASTGSSHGLDTDESQVQEAQLALAQEALRRKRSGLERELLERTHAATALEVAVSEQDRQVDEAKKRLASLQHSLQGRVHMSAGTSQMASRPLSSGVLDGVSDEPPRARPSGSGVVTQPALQPWKLSKRGRVGGVPESVPRPPSPDCRVEAGSGEDQLAQWPPSFGRGNATSRTQLAVNGSGAGKALESAHSVADGQWLPSPALSLPSPPLLAAAPETLSSTEASSTDVAGTEEASALLKLRTEVRALKARCMTQVRRNQQQRGPTRGGPASVAGG